MTKRQTIQWKHRLDLKMSKDNDNPVETQVEFENVGKTKTTQWKRRLNLKNIGKTKTTQWKRRLNLKMYRDML